MNIVTIEGQLRSEFGKGTSRRLRAEQQVPGIIYGGKENVHFSAPLTAFKKLVYSPKFQIAEVIVDGKSYRCIMKDLQFGKTTDLLTHIDFLELVDNKRINVSLPLKFTGAAQGVKDGGRLVTKMGVVKVRTTPEHLREYIEVPVDNLLIGFNIRVEDIVAPNMELMNSPRIPVVSVVTTRQLRQAAAGKDEPKGKK